MKKEKITILILFLLLLINSSFSQEITNEEYNQLLRIFNEVDFDTPLDTYQKSKLKFSGTFSHSTVLEIPENTEVSTSINKIFILVETSIFSEVENKIRRYADDINYTYGCEIVMKTVTYSEYSDIKSLILAEQPNLDGVVLIGDLPAAWYEVDADYGDTTKPAEWPCDLYYMDTDGVWGDSDSDGIFDSHTGNVQPEIFVGRISTANMGTLVSEKEGLENYLDKNHKFWTGQFTLNKKFGLSYIDKDWASIRYFKTDIQHLYGSSNYDSISYIGYSSFGKSDYLNRLSNNRYEFIHIACHSNYYFHSHIGEGDDIYGDEIFNNGTEAIGYNLYCCNGCRWTSVSSTSTRGFLGGAYIYNSNTSGLVVVGSTKTGSMLKFDKFYQPLGNGDSFGEALVRWWVDAFGTSHSSYEIYFHYGLSIIGDPLVNFYHCSRMEIKNKVLSSDATYEGCNVVIDNVTIKNSSDININISNELTIEKDFEVELGSSLEIK